MEFLGHDYKPDNYKYFLYPDEIVQKENEIFASLKSVNVEKLGITHERNEIRQIEFGSGTRNAFFIGFPHPNEPLGSLVILELEKLLAQEEGILEKLNYRFHMIAIVDPDGARLNQAWFRKYLDISEYIKNSYRPVGQGEFDSSFPVSYKSFKSKVASFEARRVSKLMANQKPNLIFNLHNSVTKGPYFYVNFDDPRMLKGLRSTIDDYKSLGFYYSIFDAPYIKSIHDGIFRMPSAKDVYEYQKNVLKFGKQDIGFGGSSYDYASRINKNLIYIVNEFPIYSIRPGKRLTEEKILKFEMVSERIERLEKTYRTMKEILNKNKPYLKEKGSIFFNSAKAYIENMLYANQKARNLLAHAGKVEKTYCNLGELVRNRIDAPIFDLCVMGMLRRLLALNDIKDSEIIDAFIESELSKIDRIAKITATDLNVLIKSQLEVILGFLVS